MAEQETTTVAPVEQVVAAPAPAGRTPVQRLIEGIICWTLLAAGTAIFGVCLLVPVWEDYALSLCREKQAQAAMDKMHNEVERTRDIIRAIKTDPLVNEELALTELNYRRQGQTRLTVQVRPQDSTEEPANTTSEIDVVERPAPTSFTTLQLAKLRERIPANLWRQIFMDPGFREKSMILAAGMVLLTLFVFGGRSAPATKPA